MEVVSTETVTADLGSRRADADDRRRAAAQRRRVKAAVIKLLGRIHAVTELGALYGLSSGDLVKVAQVKYGIEASHLAYLTCGELKRLYFWVELRPGWSKEFIERFEAARHGDSGASSL